MNMILQDKDKILNNAEEIEDNIFEEQKEESPAIIYWVNAPKIDSTLWINT